MRFNSAEEMLDFIDGKTVMSVTTFTARKQKFMFLATMMQAQ